MTVLVIQRCQSASKYMTARIGLRAPALGTQIKVQPAYIGLDVHHAGQKLHLTSYSQALDPFVQSL